MVAYSAYPLEGLLDLACRDGIDIRPTLLRVLTDLFVQKPTHSAEEEAQYVELAQRLVDAVDVPTRAAVMARLSSYPGAPDIVLQRLMELGESPAPVAPPLASTLPLPVREQTEPEPVRRSEDIELTELFFAADAEERRLILLNLDAAEPTETQRKPLAADDVIGHLENAALAHNTRDFVRTLGRVLNIGSELMTRLVHDESGEPIVVAAKLLGMKAAVLHRILLFVNPSVGHSVERVYDLALLYDEMTPAAAERMISIWRRADNVRPTRYQSAYWNVERQRTRTDNPTRSAPDSSREPLPTRSTGTGR
ncbi:MAG TPA: DUF2336 domain-containing protein [Pseudolabrys sp.]|nr:DUF2336 domain-containing protein [Pseudolabrys sp.]